MTKFTINEFQQDDVKIWGGIAVGTVCFMVLLSSMSIFMPANALNGLRETRHASGTISQLQAELTSIRVQFASMKRESSISGTRMILAEESDVKFSRRVRALESSIPMLLEALPVDADIDRSLITASINDANGEEIIKSSDKVKITRSDLFDATEDGGTTQTNFTSQSLPEKVENFGMSEKADMKSPAPVVQLSSTEFGIILGTSVASADAELLWQRYKADIGTLLLGLAPHALPAADDSSKIHLIAGPIGDAAEAVSLCAQISKAGITCKTSGFGGSSLVR